MLRGVPDNIQELACTPELDLQAGQNFKQVIHTFIWFLCPGHDACNRMIQNIYVYISYVCTYVPYISSGFIVCMYGYTPLCTIEIVCTYICTNMIGILHIHT